VYSPEVRKPIMEGPWEDRQRAGSLIGCGGALGVLRPRREPFDSVVESLRICEKEGLGLGIWAREGGGRCPHP